MLLHARILPIGGDPDIDVVTSSLHSPQLTPRFIVPRFFSLSFYQRSLRKLTARERFCCFGGGGGDGQCLLPFCRTKVLRIHMPTSLPYLTLPHLTLEYSLPRTWGRRVSSETLAETTGSSILFCGSCSRRGNSKQILFSEVGAQPTSSTLPLQLSVSNTPGRPCMMMRLAGGVGTM
jgi:hypothetical protein